VPSEIKKSLLVLVRHSPYGSSLARTSLEVALTAATYEQRVAVLFLGEGVLHLLPDQDSTRIGVKNIGKLIASFPLYELDSLFVDENALLQYAVDEHKLPYDLQSLDSAAIKDLMCSYDHILGF